MEMLLPNHCPRASDGDEWCGLSLECVNAWYIWNPWLDLKADTEINMGRIGMSFPLLYHLLRACHVAVCEAFFRPIVPSSVIQCAQTATTPKPLLHAVWFQV